VTKAELRSYYQAKRTGLSGEQREEMDRLITKAFTGIHLEGITFVHLYYPIAARAEFNTISIADWLRLTHPEISLVLPRTNADLSMDHIVWETDTPLLINRWGIGEPAAGRKIHPAQLDLILVPLLAFDQSGNRLGYGKGFYDRFLAGCRRDALKAGVSYFPPATKLPADEHDIPLDLCITPERIWQFNQQKKEAH
jgi:5-formyltetrahydrofolate cyclo-ligase